MSDLERDLLEEVGTTTFSEEDPPHKALGAHLEDLSNKDWRLEDRMSLTGDERLSGR